MGCYFLWHDRYEAHFFPYTDIFIPSHFSFPTVVYNLVTLREMAVKAVPSLSFFFCNCLSHVLIIILNLIVIIQSVRFLFINQHSRQPSDQKEKQHNKNNEG